MRKIRFRGYCPHDKKMYLPVYFDNLEVWWWNPETKETEILGDRHPDSMLIHIEIMQYIGLRDKHMVEIYCGDIYHNPSYPFSENYVADMHETIYHHYSDIRDHSGKGSAEWEIIGNVYENQELLKGGTREHPETI